MPSADTVASSYRMAASSKEEDEEEEEEEAEEEEEGELRDRNGTQCAQGQEVRDSQRKSKTNGSFFWLLFITFLSVSISFF